MVHTALLVDDDPMTLTFLEQALSPTGVQSYLAYDGSQAIEVLQRSAPVILFLDLLLPKVSGMEVLDFVLNSPHLTNMFVAIISAHDHFPPSPQLDRADVYYVKPLRLKDIRGAVQQAIDRHSG